MAFCVYILASRQRGTLYASVSNDLARRVHEHREKAGSTFTRRYGVTRLVYYETLDSPDTAITREKRLKRWPRAWKVQAIEKPNPDWRDLYEDLNRQSLACGSRRWIPDQVGDDCRSGLIDCIATNTVIPDKRSKAVR